MGVNQRPVKDVMSQYEQSEQIQDTGNGPTVDNEAELIAQEFPESIVLGED